MITSLFMMMRPGRGFWVISLLIAANMIMFAATISYWFTGWDTLSLIYTASVSSLADCATRPVMFATNFVQDGLYFRPVIALLFWIQYRLFGLHPMGYYAVSLTFHIATVVLVARIAATLCSPRAGLLAGAIFTLHPMILENVPVSRGQDIVATAFALGAVYLFLNRRYRWGAVAGALALLSKETGVLALPMALAVLWWQRADWRKIVPLAAAVGICLLWRWRVLGGLGGYTINPGKLELALSVAFYYPGYLWIPWSLNQTVDALPELAAIVTVSGVICIAVWQLRRRRRVLLTGLFAILPMALFATTMLQYWYFYLAAALGSLFLSVLILALWQERRLILAPVVVMAILLVAINRPGLDTWRQVGETNKALLDQMENIAERHPGETLYVNSALGEVRNRAGGIRAVHFLQGHSISSYFKLRGKTNDVAVVSMVRLAGMPGRATVIVHQSQTVKWQYDVEILSDWMMMLRQPAEPRPAPLSTGK